MPGELAAVFGVTVVADFGITKVAAGEENAAGRSAHGGSGVVVGELEAVLGELVKVGRFDLGLAVGSDFAVAEIVGENEDDVGFFGSVGGRDEKEREKFFHDRRRRWQVLKVIQTLKLRRGRQGDQAKGHVVDK